MSEAVSVIQQIYAAFGRQDVPAILELVSETPDWEFVGSPGLAYAGNRRSREQVGEFFAAVGQNDDVHVFEPREFIAAGDHVTVLGWEKATARDTGNPFATEWMHLFTVRDGKVTRWRGFFNTAARYGM